MKREIRFGPDFRREQGLLYTFRMILSWCGLRRKKRCSASRERDEIGVVKDKKMENLTGSDVLVGGTTLGTATDAKGEFLLKVPEQESVALHFSFVGMKHRSL